MIYYKLFKQICFLSFFICIHIAMYGQENAPLNCTDVKNGTFNYYDQKNGLIETFTRKGNLQKENIPKQRESILWEVNWLSDCVYTIKYQSGAENHPAAELKILNKHVIAVEILHVTEDYMTFRTALDKITNATILNDTLWIKQRQAVPGKMITNPRADSIASIKKQLTDSTLASYATLYVYRPGKLLDYAVSYDLLINGEKVCVITNGCRYKLQLRKPGKYTITAKLSGDQTVTLDVKPGGVYYLQCTTTWGLKYHKEVHIMDNKQGADEYNASEKAN